MARWVSAHPVTALYSHKFLQEICGYEKKISFRENYTTKRWNVDIQEIKVLFDGTFVDPFSIINPPSSLANIATSAVPPKDMRTVFSKNT